MPNFGVATLPYPRDSRVSLFGPVGTATLLRPLPDAAAVAMRTAILLTLLLLATTAAPLASAGPDDPLTCNVLEKLGGNCAFPLNGPCGTVGAFCSNDGSPYWCVLKVGRACL